MDNSSETVELNVGGVFYTTSVATLTREPSSLLGQMFGGSAKTLKDSKVRFFSAPKTKWGSVQVDFWLFLENLCPFSV